MTRKVFLAAAVGAGLLAASLPASAALRILKPANGSTVREKVQVVVPRADVPQSGFVALYVDGRFIVAQSPSRNPSQPLALAWNTKGKLPESVGGEPAEITDGTHTLEVRSYNNAGDLLESRKITVRVDNDLAVRRGQPILLAYRFRVGDITPYNHRVEVVATPTSGAVTVSPGTTAEMKLVENAGFKVFVEDVVDGKAFMRERRESPVLVSLNDQRTPYPVDSSSRYFDMDRTGQVDRTLAMERERRHALVNVIRLPGRSVRVGESWRSPVRISMGDFIPGPLVVTAKHTLSGVVWAYGRPAAKIVSTYEGNVKIALANLGIPTGDFKYKGKSTTLFAPSVGRVLRATHELDGDLTIDLLQQQGNQVGPVAGGFAPSLGGGVGAGYGAPGGRGYGAPSGAGGSPYAPPGATPGYGPPGGGYGGPPGGSPGYGPPGGGYGGPPGAGGYPGGYGGYPGSYGGTDPGAYGGTPAQPTTQTYKTKINVSVAVAS
jgi:hypothetical protein